MLDIRDRYPQYGLILYACSLIDDLPTVQIIPRLLVSPSPQIVVPFRVRYELETLAEKPGKENIRNQVRNAIRWIESLVNKQTKNVIIQTKEEEEKAGGMFVAQTGDEKILQLCLSLKKERRVILLVTNDKEFSEIATLHNISTVNTRREDLLHKVKNIIQN